MENYILIVSRSDFDDLYKYGHLFVHNVIPFDGELSNQKDNKALFEAVTTYMNTYDYSSEYLLLHIRRNVFTGSSVEIFIKDVVAIYALDMEAHAQLSASLDSRINLRISPWALFFNELNKKQAIRQSKAGKFNCYEIFRIPQEERAKIDSFFPSLFIDLLGINLFGHTLSDMRGISRIGMIIAVSFQMRFMFMRVFFRSMR